MRSRSSTTPHLPSYFLLITSIQLFHHQFYGHTFPVPNEPTKSEVHQIPSHPVMICRIELPHFFCLYCPVCCDIIATLRLYLFVDTKKVPNLIVDSPSQFYTPRLAKPPLSELQAQNLERPMLRTVSPSSKQHISSSDSPSFF